MLIAVLQRKLCRKRAAKNFTGRLRGAFPINPRYIRSTAQQAARRRSLEFQERRIVRIRAPKGAQNMTLCIAAVKAARMRDLKAHVVTAEGKHRALAHICAERAVLHVSHCILKGKFPALGAISSG